MPLLIILTVVFWGFLTAYAPPLVAFILIGITAALLIGYIVMGVLEPLFKYTDDRDE